MAVTAMVLGLVGIVTACAGVGVIVGLVGLILGIIALRETGDPPFAKKGKGMAITGIATGGASLALALAPLALAIGIMLPALGAARRSARQMQNGTQLRGIHQAMINYSQSNKTGGRPGYFPGLDAQGNPRDLTASGRLKILLDKGYFTPDYLISPAEPSATLYPGQGPFSSANHSYAVLDISESGGRRSEWSETLNRQAIVLTDRNTGSKQSPASIWTQGGGQGQWRGGVTRNDNSTGFEPTHVLQTQYGNGPVNASDSIFNSTSTDDAAMIHQGK